VFLRLVTVLPDNNKISKTLRSVPGYVTVPNIVRFIGLALVVIAAGFYIGWSIIYGTWTDIGLYSFVAPVFVFGILTLMYAQEKYHRSTEN
jgi:hypothetical protein